MANSDSNPSFTPVGEPSDSTPEILATGRSGISTLYVSMSERHPEGKDRDYLQWHTLDHRPEQYRLADIKAALRFVSTPACRAARAASDDRFDPVDHVMTYFFHDIGGLKAFYDLAVALTDAGRVPYLLPAVERGAYSVDKRSAATRIKVGADILPWWPITGVYLMVENGTASTAKLTDVPGVAGVWKAHAVATDISDAEEGQQITYCFLDGDPVETAKLLQPVMQARWESNGITPRLAAPYYLLVPREWDRYLP